MSKEKFIPGQTVYTIGETVLPEGSKLTVASDHKGGDMVSCIDELKKYFFIRKEKLSAIKPTSQKVITDETVINIKKAFTIPSWLMYVGTSYIAPSRMVYVFGFPELADQSVVYVADNHIHNFYDKEVRCIVKGKSPWVYYTIPKENLCIPTQGTHSTIPAVKKPLASEFDGFTEDHKYMIELLKEPSRVAVIQLVLQGVDIDQYNIIAGLKHYVLVPKKPATTFMPMIMAHTDIQRNVSHPNENLEYDPIADKFSSPKGLGADDRAGCYAINKILINHPGKFIIALFDEEEIGCIGSTAFTNTKEFADIDKLASCYISIDRRRGYGGAHQIATYGHDNEKLFDLVKTATGRAKVGGSSTDCKALSTGSDKILKNQGLACFNMSCGYDGEHTASEVLYFKELQTVVTDFDCMVLSAPELWDERFLSEKAKKHIPIKYNNNWDNLLDDAIDVDGEMYDESDVRTLLWLYHQMIGVPYEFNKATHLCKDFAKSTYVRFDSTCTFGSVYGGVKLTKDMYNALNAYTWVVVSVKNKKYNLRSECGVKTATNIPAAWLTVVLVGDPISQTN